VGLPLVEDFEINDPVFDEVVKDNDPQFLQRAQEEFPRLKSLDMGYKYTPRQDRGFIEFYPADEPGSPEYPRPKELPLGKPGIEVYNPKTRPIDVAGDIASHYMIYNDPKMIDYYGRFRQSITPEQQQRMQQQYQFYQQNYGETRPYDKWYEMTGLPGYFRGYPFQQWSPEIVEQAYNQDQRALLDEMLNYLRSTE
jgi:hypothetical protein